MIYYLSSQSVLQSFELDTYDFIFKKCAHIFVYAVLYWLFFRAIQMLLHKRYHTTNKLWLIPLAVTFLYAMSDELHQTFVPGRTGTFRDLGYDLIGMGIVFLWKYRYI